MADSEVKDPSEIIKGINDAKSKDSFTVINETVQGSLMGAAIGAGGGLVIGYLKHYNLFYSAVFGMFIGGFLSSIFLNKK